MQFQRNGTARSRQISRVAEFRSTHNLDLVKMDASKLMPFSFPSNFEPKQEFKPVDVTPLKTIISNFDSWQSFPLKVFLLPPNSYKCRSARNTGLGITKTTLKALSILHG